jgi:hypothetical protein
MQHFSQNDIQAMAQRYRAAFINSLPKEIHHEETNG